MNVRVLTFAAALALLAVGYFARTPDPGGVKLQDFEASYAAGSTWSYHGDPYGRDVWRAERAIPHVMPARDEVLPFVGPPFALPLWSALSHLSYPHAVAVWKGVMVLAIATVVLCSLAIAGGAIDALDVLAAFAAAAAFAPITGGAALGQSALVAFAGIVATPLLLRVRTAYAGAAAVVVAALQPNLAIVLPARIRDSRSSIAVLAAGAIVLGGSAVALAGLGGLGHYAQTLRAQAEAERYIAIQTTVAAVTRAFGASPHVAGIVAIAAAFLAIAAVVAIRVSGRFDADVVLALACAAVPLAIPFAHEHDFDVAFFPALVAIRRTRGFARAVAVVATLAISVDWLGLAQRPGSTLEACAFVLAEGAALAVIARARSVASVALPILAALVVALVALPAATHVLPTWPERLPLHFRVAREATAAEVWGAEQRATGIAALDPYWALLRTFPLAGCTLLLGAGIAGLSAPRKPSPRAIASRPPAAARPSV